MTEKLKELEARIGYTFRDFSLLERAMMHSSYTNEKNLPKYECNERLEFLGDAVLELISSEFLFRESPHMAEGELTKTRASMVCEPSLAMCARDIGLGNYLLLGKGEENTGGRTRPSVVSDAFEAVLAAIYLDGGYEPAKRFVLRFMPKHMDIHRISMTSDYITALQEIIQKNREEKIEYVLAGESGPDHNKAFTVEVHLNSNVIGTGTGRSKKQAVQLGAKEALSLMGYET